MIEREARHMRETWGATLSRLRRKVLGEHSMRLELLYAEAIQSMQAISLPPPAQPLSTEHWLACEDIASPWKALMHGAALDMDHPVGYDMFLEHVLHVQRGYDTINYY